MHLDQTLPDPQPEPGLTQEAQMSFRSTFILLGILLALTFQQTALSAEQVLLPGKTSISGLEVKQIEQGVWMADFDYFYTGEPFPLELRIELAPKLPTARPVAGLDQTETYLASPMRGQHHLSVGINYPGGEGVTRQVTVTMRGPLPEKQLYASQQIEQTIEWPTYYTWLSARQEANRKPEENFNYAVELIDTDGAVNLQEAKIVLERLIAKDPKFAAGYIELARIAMKSNWSPQGLHQAETLLLSALQLQPDSVNAKILLGYVYAHQDHYSKAEALFAEAARSDTRNLWLWTNWGELLEMQNKTAQAMVKYREAISRPMNHDGHDRARRQAYVRLLAILGQRKDIDGMELLYKQRIAEFGPGSCFSADYSRFLLDVRGDTQASIDLSRRALNQDCEDSESREILGLAHYVKWASASGPDRTESLNQARIYLPAGPMPIYLLASQTRTLPAAKALIATGEQIDQQDNFKMTALAYALQKNDLGTAQRLLALGARADEPVGMEEMPLAFMPVMEGNVDAIRMLKKAGVDYSKLRFQGTSALQIAKQMGNEELIAVLGREETVL
jgi:tetratricopeptide (TPR) repeat protein